MNTGFVLRFLALGTGIWLAATIAFRLVGQYLLNPVQPLITTAVFSIAAPLMFFVGRLLVQSVPPTERSTAAICLWFPGMALDMITTVWFQAIFPNMDVASDQSFGGLMLWGYSFALLGGMTSPQPRAASNS
jgi:hypothetical protein